MRLRTALIPMLTAAAGWYSAMLFQDGQRASMKNPSGVERRIRCYQSPMHPWVKSDKPGQCTICGMDLVPIYEAGWKDTIYLPRNETVTVIGKFDDFASNTNPFMFHCHFLQHEDGGMMGQFRVVNNAVEDLAIASFTRIGTSSLISLQFKATVGTTYNLQYSPDMTTSSWVSIGSVTSDGTSATFTETDAMRLGQARGFYRVTIPKIP